MTLPTVPTPSRSQSPAILSTVRTRIIGPEARTLELPLLVRSGSFFSLLRLQLGLMGSVFAVRSPPYPREGIPDVSLGSNYSSSHGIKKKLSTGKFY